MRKYSIEINDLADLLKEGNRPLGETLSELSNIQKIVDAGAEKEKKTYRLPYSSNPTPLGERWHTA